MRTMNLLGAVAAAATLLGASAAPALATDSDQEVGLHQPTPITADDPEFAQGEECSGIPAGSDGWHFVLPGNSTTFVELRVTFEPGGEQVITAFGPPSDKHAYVASEPGAELVAASATVNGDDVNFRLSHTCPATDVPGEEPEEPGEEPEEPGEEPEEPGEEPEEPGEETPSEETPSEEPGGVADGSGGEQPPVGDEADDADLAETGSSLPVLPLTIGALVLVGGGGYLALRVRRTARG